MTTNMSISAGIHAFDIHAFEAKSDPWRATKYAQAVDKAIQQNSAGVASYYLWRLSSGELHDRNPWIYMLEWNGIVFAACHVDGEAGKYEIKGLIKAPGTRPYVPRDVVALAISETFARRGDGIRLDACIRIMPTGWLSQSGLPCTENVPSRQLFQEFHFEPLHSENVLRFMGDYRDGHLRDSLESDGSYRNRTLVSTPGTREAARVHLASRGYFG